MWRRYGQKFAAYFLVHPVQDHYMTLCFCMQPVYYKSQLVRRVMPMTFNLSEKRLRCVANVPRSSFDDVESSIVIAFNKCQSLDH